MDSLVTLNMEFRLFFFVTFWIIIIGRKALGIVRGAPLGTPDVRGTPDIRGTPLGDT